MEPSLPPQMAARRPPSLESTRGSALRLRPSLVGLVVAFLGIVALVTLDDTGHLQWAVRVVTAIPLGDKVGHFFGFGTLAFFVARIFPGRRVFGLVPLAVLVALLATGLEELSQAWVPWRHCDPWDFVADTLGMASFTWLALRLPDSRRILEDRAARSPQV